MNNFQQTFLLDANVFIEAHRRYYSFDICPGFWTCLLHYNRSSCIYSIDRVHEELKSDDLLDRWLKNSVPSSMFLSTADANVVRRYKDIMEWIQKSTQFKEEAKADFARDADGWLVAYAAAYQCIVVTQEVYNAEIRKKVPIPNICMEFGVMAVDTFKMLRAIKAQFDWNPE